MKAASERPIGDCLRAAAATLPGDSPRLDAELLLGHCLQRSRAWLFAHSHDPLPSAIAVQFDALVERRRHGTPIAHLIGEREFWSLPLIVSPDTLIPRPETERLVELALMHLPVDRPARVLDLGTGTGAVAIAIAHERPMTRIIATDISPAALAIARRNIARHVPGRIETRCGDWFQPVAGIRFDLIVSNPPYIPLGDPHLTQGDLPHEPVTALSSGGDGLHAIRHIVAGALDQLCPGGWLLLEHGHDQGASLRTLLAQAGLTDITTAQDIEQRDRVSLGRSPGQPQPTD